MKDIEELQVTCMVDQIADTFRFPSTFCLSSYSNKINPFLYAKKKKKSQSRRIWGDECWILDLNSKPGLFNQCPFTLGLTDKFSQTRVLWGSFSVVTRKMGSFCCC